MGLNIQKGQKWLEDSLLKLNSLALFSGGIKLDLKWRDLAVLLVCNLKTFSKMCKDVEIKQSFDPHFNINWQFNDLL